MNTLALFFLGLTVLSIISYVRNGGKQLEEVPIDDEFDPLPRGYLIESQEKGKVILKGMNIDVVDKFLQAFCKVMELKYYLKIVPIAVTREIWVLQLVTEEDVISKVTFEAKGGYYLLTSANVDMDLILSYIKYSNHSFHIAYKRLEFEKTNLRPCST